MKEIPAWQPNSPASLLETKTHPSRVVIPETKYLAVSIDRDPAVVLH